MSELQKLTTRQLKAIPHLLAGKTWEEGRKKARVSRDTFYRWLKETAFKEELTNQRNAVIGEGLDRLKANMLKAVETLVELLSSESDSIKRGAANDILGCVLKVRELEDLERRLTALEAQIKGRK